LSKYVSGPPVSKVLTTVPFSSIFQTLSSGETAAQTKPPPTAIEPTQSRSFTVLTTWLTAGSISLMDDMLLLPTQSAPSPNASRSAWGTSTVFTTRSSFGSMRKTLFASATQTEPAPMAASVGAVKSMSRLFAGSGMRWIVP
jgi:hypothetical protein